jgi:transposase
MVTRRYALRDDQRARIAHPLPGRAGHVGGTATDNRLVVDAVPYRRRAGIPWADLPERFGNAESIGRRSRRWAASGVRRHGEDPPVAGPGHRQPASLQRHEG